MSTSTSTPAKRAPPPDERDDEATGIAIKRRQVRVKKLRRHDDMESEDADEKEPPQPPDASVAGDAQPETSTSTSRSPPLSPRASKRPVSPTSSKARSPSPVGYPRSAYARSRALHPGLMSCRSVYNYTRLNHIEEGTYGVVFRAKCNDTGEIYALKKLKLDEERHGFPITSLREIMALMTAGDHENVVGIREIVVGDTLNQ